MNTTLLKAILDKQQNPHFSCQTLNQKTIPSSPH